MAKSSITPLRSTVQKPGYLISHRIQRVHKDIPLWRELLRLNTSFPRTSRINVDDPGASRLTPAVHCFRLLCSLIKLTMSLPLPPVARAKNWCFTIRDYTPGDVARIRKIVAPLADYLVIGFFTNEAGRAFIDGFVSFKSRQRTHQARTICGGPRAHVYMPNSQAYISVLYCKRNCNYEESGTFTKQGARADLFGRPKPSAAVKLTVKRRSPAHKRLCQSVLPAKPLLAKHPNIHSLYRYAYNAASKLMAYVYT